MKFSKEREKVNAFLDDKFIVRKGFDPIDISKGIDWNHQHYKSANTYQTYLHSLDIVSDIVKISKYDENDKLLKYAREIILDWNKTNHTKGKNFAWKEHPVSSRISNIIEFQNEAGKYELEKSIFNDILIEHCEFLYEERHYKFNNHGLMMDYSLLNACKYLTDEKIKKVYIGKAIYRIRYALLRDFTRKGVHLENSPEYHRLVLALFRKIEKVLKELKLSIGKDESEIIKLAQEYRNYIIKPNLEYPMIGDTGNIIDPRIKKRFDDFIDHDSGMAILHLQNKENIENSTMFTFKSGYQKKTHKHRDDLSITLYLQGKDLLIDSGKYSYDSKDPIRKHIISPQAHNTICVSKKDYELNNPFLEQKKMKLTKFINKKKYKIVSGINKLYTGINITRHNILSEYNILFIVDRVVCNNVELIYQNFNFHESAEVKKINDLTYEIVLEGEEFILKTFERYDSKITSEIKRGYVSRGFLKYVSNSRIILKQHSKNATFITAIFNKKILDNLEEVSLINNKLKYTAFSEEVTIEL